MTTVINPNWWMRKPRLRKVGLSYRVLWLWHLSSRTWTQGSSYLKAHAVLNSRLTADLFMSCVSSTPARLNITSTLSSSTGAHSVSGLSFFLGSEGRHMACSLTPSRFNGSPGSSLTISGLIWPRSVKSVLFSLALFKSSKCKQRVSKINLFENLKVSTP